MIVKKPTCMVEMVQSSIYPGTNKPIFTLVMDYPRGIHAQLLTHKVFSKNSSSTRAVPLAAAMDQILKNPAKYIWTQNQSGMQGTVIEDTKDLEEVFHTAKESAMYFADKLQSLGAHKQNAGRLLEPFQNIRIVLTSTEWKNWDWLRIHEDAQGEIAELAQAMKEVREATVPMKLKQGEWHVPFVNRERGAETGELYYTANGEQVTVEEAKAISASVCAQVSYRKADSSLEKASKMRGMLIDGHKVHASPFEHQAMVMPEVNVTGRLVEILASLPDGVTHICKDGQYGSGNFKGWVQSRQLMKNHDKELF